MRSAHQRGVLADGMHTPTLPSCTSEGARCLRGAKPPCLAMRPRRDGMGRTPQRDARVREFAPNLPWPPNGRHGCGAADWTGTGNRGPCSQRGCWATSMSSHKHGRMPRCEQRRPSRAVRDGAFCQCTKSKSRMYDEYSVRAGAESPLVLLRGNRTATLPVGIRCCRPVYRLEDFMVV